MCLHECVERSANQRVGVRGCQNAVDARRRDLQCSREAREIPAFSIGVAGEKNLEAKSMRAEHIMVRQLASDEDGRALGSGRFEETRPTSRADRKALVAACDCGVSPRPFDSATSESQFEPSGDFLGIRRKRKPRARHALLVDARPLHGLHLSLA